MNKRTIDEMITYFNQEVSKMDISQENKIKLLGMITAIGFESKKQDVGHGVWINKYPLSTCSVCKATMILNDYSNYCPNCGADMRKEQADERM